MPHKFHLYLINLLVYLTNNIMHAKTRKELDTALNKKRLDRIVLSGAVPEGNPPPPKEKDQKIAWMKNLAVSVLKQFAPDAERIVENVFQLGRDDANLYEVKLYTKEQAADIRKEFVDQKKAGKVPRKLYLTNSVTLATRVRAEIMWGMANQYSTREKKMYAIVPLNIKALHWIVP